MTNDPEDSIEARHRFADYLRRHYLGPAAGPRESLRSRPDRTYLVGTLYPRGPAGEPVDPDTVGVDGHDDELDEPIELTNTWYPSSAAVSFLHDGDTLRCSVEAGRYERVEESETAAWRRTPLHEPTLDLRPGDGGSPVLEGRARLSAVWRPVGRRWLVTVAVANHAEHDQAESRPPTEQCLFQISLTCQVLGGAVLPYPSSQDLSREAEDEELRLLYRERRTYGVGHGCSVDWASTTPGGPITTVATEMLPATTVPAVKAPNADLPVLRLSYLADDTHSPEELCDELDAFVELYEQWINRRRTEATGLPTGMGPAAERLLGRMDRAARRMRDGVRLLRREDGVDLEAFRLANLAMRDHMRQSSHIVEHPGRRGVPLTGRVDGEADEPVWRPFQLGFQLLTLASTADEDDHDRETVDLIWFPTGGGKTEAYLGLAAFEMIRRRLRRGLYGGGTAVLSRYTLRLLTGQQFQRAAALICALQRVRSTRGELRDAPPFSIGLWVGGDTTPNSFGDAHKVASAARAAYETETPFQIESCPWCGTDLAPARHSSDDGAYGWRTTASTFELHCPHEQCEFHDLLPVSVVDDALYQEPPTLLLATVDKIARLPWLTEAGSLFGLNNKPYDPPSLIIQDELHLLSGPLGTTVALYEAGVHGLLEWGGHRPKIVASTATIRASEHQVRGLYGHHVELYPPSGLDADDSFFARTDHQAPGRLYIGLMPQAHSPAYATVLSCAALLQAPREVDLGEEHADTYWTLVAYHSSLRELGRTVTIARDDVKGLLEARGGTTGPRELHPDGVVELTSNVSAAELRRRMRRLERRVDSGEAIDVLASTNMLSVGIDISRLGLMLMNGQPKTTSEYIQATSRVGRASPGVVVTLLRSSKPRDRSHYEGFRAYHEALYRHVEPTSVTPWSLASRKRSLHAALVTLVRHGAGLRRNEDASRFRRDDPYTRAAVTRILRAVEHADPAEADATRQALDVLVAEWDDRARKCQDVGEVLRYSASKGENLLKEFGERDAGWSTMHSMRSVDRQVRVRVPGEESP